MSEAKAGVTFGPGFILLSIATLFMLGLKTSTYPELSWFFVFLPVLAPGLLMLGVLVAVTPIAIVMTIANRKRD